MKNSPFKSCGLMLSLLATSCVGGSTQLMAAGLSNDQLNHEVQEHLLPESGHTDMSEALVDSLYTLGWTEEQTALPYLSDLSDDLSMQTLIHMAYTESGHAFTPMDCILQDWQSVSAGQTIQSSDFSQHSCLDGLKQSPLGAAEHTAVYLVAAEVMSETQSKKSEPMLRIESNLDSLDWISRKISSAHEVAVQQEWFVISNRCGLDACDMSVVLRGLAVDSDVKLTLKGIYSNDKPMEKSVTARFFNGGFSKRSEGWGWHRKVGQQTCFNNLSAPNSRINPDIRFHPQTGNAYAVASGHVASVNAASATVTESISQTLMTVPDHASVNFRYSLSQAALFNGTAQRAAMRLVAYDFSTGQSSVIFNHAINSGSTGWRAGSADLSAFANKRVNFRFEVCSSLTSSTGVGSSFHGRLFLDDVALEVAPPVNPSGSMSHNGPCQLVGNNNTCTTDISWESQDTAQVCIWQADGAVDLLSCSDANQGLTQFHDTTTQLTNIVMKNHENRPANNLADYMAGTFLDLETVQALPASTASGILNSQSPCELPVGGNRCTVTLRVQAQNTPINCLWTTSPQMRLVSCSTAMLRSFNWIYANTTGHQFELRAHDTYPQQNNVDRLSGTFLDGERVYAVPNSTITPDSYDNVAIRGYADDLPGDAVVLYAGQTAQFHNFHDAGDQDWTIFALGPGQGVQVNTNPTGSIAAKMIAYIVTGAYSEISPGRWDIGMNDLTQLTSDTSAGNNSVTIRNQTSQLQVYVVKTYGSQHGNGSAYYISSNGL